MTVGSTGASSSWRPATRNSSTSGVIDGPTFATSRSLRSSSLTRRHAAVAFAGTRRADSKRARRGARLGRRLVSRVASFAAGSRMRLWAATRAHTVVYGRRVRGPSVTGRCRAPHESARNAGGTPGCGTVDGAARRTPGTPTGAPPVPAGRGCRHPACGAPAGREAAVARAVPVRTPTAGTRVRTHRTGSLAPRPAPCRAAATRAAGCSMRSYVHGRATAPPICLPWRSYRHTPLGVPWAGEACPG
jgi:hypothetical protein